LAVTRKSAIANTRLRRASIVVLHILISAAGAPYRRASFSYT
jgi:hypothetical protein